MTTITHILEELETASGRTEREDLLNTHSENVTLQAVLFISLNPYLVFHVKKFKMPPASTEPIEDDSCFASFTYFLQNNLAERELTGNAARDEVINRFKNMSALQQKWCHRILMKNLRCGVQATTVNKIWPTMIVSFNVQLAKTLASSHDKDKGITINGNVKFPVRVEPKLDGLRCVFVKHKGTVTAFTRNGNTVETLPTISSIIERAPVDDVVIDGEVFSENWNTSSSVMMSHKRHKDDSEMVYNVFDILDHDEWVANKSKTSLIERIVSVEDFVNKCSDKHVVQVPGVIAHNNDDILDFYSKCLKDAFEGVMIKNLMSPYVFDRTDAVLKLKPTITVEGMIVGWYSGRLGTKREGLFNGLIVCLTNNITTRVGSGLNDAIRHNAQIDGPDTLVGKIVECECQPDPATSDGLTSDGKMHFPVFVRFRDASDVDPKVVEAGTRWLESGSVSNDEEDI